MYKDKSQKLPAQKGAGTRELLSAGTSEGGSNEQSLLEIDGHVHKADHHRDFDQRTDHRGEGRAAIDPEYGNRDGNRQLEVVARSGESEGGCLTVIRANAAPHVFREEVVKKYTDAQILSRVYFFVTYLQAANLALAAGDLLYVALVDSLPELHKERKPAVSLTQFALLFFGLVVLWPAKFISHD